MKASTNKTEKSVKTGKPVKTVGILTSGGDAPGLNAAIRALCISGKNNYGMKFIGIRNGYRGLIDNDTFKMDELDLEPLISQGGTILGTSRVKPFKNPVPDPKTGLLPVEGIKETFKKISLMPLSALAEMEQIQLLLCFRKQALT